MEIRVMQDTTQTNVHFLQRPEGKIAYETAGKGPLVICVPGLGDLRQSYRYIIPELAKAKYRVVSMDLRGHGDSDTTFKVYNDEAVSSDITALIQELGGPATIIGNSLGAGAAVIVAARHPKLVRDIVLTGPSVRNQPMNIFYKLLVRTTMLPLWASNTWDMLLPKFFAGTKPADFEEYKQLLVAAIKKPGHAKAFFATSRTSHELARQLTSEVNVPSLTLMGALDPEFKKPNTEMNWIKNALHGQGSLIADAGHYPQSQQPERMLKLLIPFLEEHIDA